LRHQTTCYILEQIETSQGAFRAAQAWLDRSLPKQAGTPMTTLRSTLIGIPLVFLSGMAFAQSSDQQVSRELKSCFQVASLADSICEKQTDSAERLSCVEKTRAAQIECLQRILPEEAAIAPKISEPSAVAATEGSTVPEVAVTHNEPAAVIRPAETVLPTELARPAEAVRPTEISEPMDVAKPVEPAQAVETARPTEAAKPAAQPAEAGLPSANAKAMINSEETKWVVSETTSPINYSPLVSAIIRPRQQVNSGLSGLTISCRGKRTELSLRLMGDVNVPRFGEIRIDSQIGDQRPVKQRWIWDEQGTILIYQDDPVALLQSIPEGARLRLGFGDSKGARHMATYQLFGLDSVRKKVANACAWPPSSAQASSEKQ
jgi:hypothetical protein